jgi:hypothetical protein
MRSEPHHTPSNTPNNSRPSKYNEIYPKAERKKHHAVFLAHLRELAEQATEYATHQMNAATIAAQAIPMEEAAGMPPGQIGRLKQIVIQMNWQAAVSQQAAIDARFLANKHEAIQSNFDAPESQQAEHMTG